MTKRLTKQDLLDSTKSRVAEKRPDLAKADVEAVADALWDSIRQALADGNVVPIPGFGIFEPRKAPSVPGATRNPARRSRLPRPRPCASSWPRRSRRTNGG